MKTEAAFKTSFLCHPITYQQMPSFNQQMFTEHLIDILIKTGRYTDK